MKDKKVTILLIEDNPGDARLIREALKDEGLDTDLHIAGDGGEALAFLRREEGFADAPRPDLIVLDLNLPKKDGREVLAEIKNDRKLRAIQIIVLTGSHDQKDIAKCTGLDANLYVTKPDDLDQFSTIVKTIANFWKTTI